MATHRNLVAAGTGDRRGYRSGVRRGFDPGDLPITTNTFIVYTSNVFAILGLRSMYFLLAGVVEKFQYLRMGLAIVLTSSALRC